MDLELRRDLAPHQEIRHSFAVLPFYDTHAHLDYPDYKDDLPGVIERARDAGITKIISIGTDLESSRRAISLAEKFPAVFAAVGWHPSNVLEAPADIRDELSKLGRHPKVVALGETGLDYHRLPSKMDPPGAVDDTTYKIKQAALFKQHLEIASLLSLNCIIHQRDAMEDTLQILAPGKDRPLGVFHCFSDTFAAQERVMQIGCLVSFTGIVTFKNAGTVRETVAKTPSGRFMLETDCPFLAPVPFRGKRCEPAYVEHIARVVAETRACSIDELSEQTCATAHRFFPKLLA